MQFLNFTIDECHGHARKSISSLNFTCSHDQHTPNAPRASLSGAAHAETRFLPSISFGVMTNRTHAERA